MICSKCGKPEAVIIVTEESNFFYLCTECYELFTANSLASKEVV